MSYFAFVASRRLLSRKYYVEKFLIQDGSQVRGLFMHVVLELPVSPCENRYYAGEFDIGFPWMSHIAA